MDDTDTLHPALAALVAALADADAQAGRPDEPRKVLLLSFREWRDGCLELGGPDEACTDAITPGYLVELDGGFSYHADSHGRVRRVPNRPPAPDTEVRLRYERAGGIGGFRTEYETTSFELTSEEDLELRDLIERSGFFDVSNTLSPPIPDGVETTLFIAVGRRSHTVVRQDHVASDDSEALRELFAWAARRAPAWGRRMAVD